MNNKYGLVFSGGGAKGSYEIGAWKALKELKIDIECVAGVSIGAINGAAFVAGDFDKAIEMWCSIEVIDGINFHEELPDQKELYSTKNAAAILKEITKNGGVDVTPTKNHIAKYINEYDVRKSNIPLVMISYDLTDSKPMIKYIDEIPNGELFDYLMASARVPGFKKMGPDNKSFVDGGVFDNNPITLIQKRGIHRIIDVDISEIKGSAHTMEIAGYDFVYITPKNIDDLGPFTAFSKELALKRINMGYLDTMRAFGKLSGQHFYFENSEFKKLVEKYSYKTVDEFENLALKFEIEKYKIYTSVEFMNTLQQKYNETRGEDEKEAFTKKLLLGIKDISIAAHKKLQSYLINTRYEQCYDNALKILNDKYDQIKSKTAE